MNRTELAFRTERIRQALQQTDADACLLTVDVNLYYTTGQIFSGYYYIPAEGDPMTFVKRPAGLAGERLVYIRKPEQLAEQLAAAGLPAPRTLLLELDELPYNECLRLRDALQPAHVGNATALMRQLRQLKSAYEIEQFRRSARQHEAVYAQIAGCYRTGMTDVELQAEIERLMRRHGSIGLFRTFGTNMSIFMGSLLAGDNAQEPSPFDFALGGRGTSPTLPIGACGDPLVEGTTVMVDMAGNYTAYITDMTRTFAVGTVPGESQDAHRVSIEIQREVMRTARPGMPCADIYQLAFQTAEREGLAPYFMGTRQQARFVGHGIGLQINELPVLSPQSKEVLQPGMVFALEPKFVLPGIGAVGIENSFVVTETGIEKLTQFEEQIIPLV